MSDERDRDGVDPRIAFEFAFGEFWEFVIVALGQVLTDLAQLFFDDVIVVDKPFRGGRDCAAFTKRFDESAICGFEFAGVVFEASAAVVRRLFG